MFDPLRAARAAGNAYTSALNAGLRYMPNFGATVRDSLKNDFDERMQAYDLNFQLDKTKKDSAAALDEYNRNRSTNSYVQDQKRQSQRFAGVLSGLGLTATAFKLKQQNDKYRQEMLADKRERDRINEARIAAYNASKEASKARLKVLKESYKPFEPVQRTDEEILKDGGYTNIPTSSPTSSPTSNLTSGDPIMKIWAPLTRIAEGTEKMGSRAYNTGYGYNMFDDLSRHPDTVWRTNTGASAAAGAYQFMPQTWAGVKSALNLTDFSPASQDKGFKHLFVQRLKNAGLDPNRLPKNDQELAKYFNALSPEWAAYPTLQNQSFYEGVSGNTASPFSFLRSEFLRLKGGSY